MVLEFQVEISYRYFDKANKRGKTGIVKQTVISGNGEGKWFDRPRGAWQSALQKAMLVNMIDDISLLGIALTFDKDKILEKIANGHVIQKKTND